MILVVFIEPSLQENICQTLFLYLDIVRLHLLYSICSDTISVRLLRGFHKKRSVGLDLCGRGLLDEVGWKMPLGKVL